MATQRTINSERLLGLTERYAKNKKVLAQACPGLVERVEACDLTGQKTKRLLKQYIDPLIEQGADTLILGCTHYPFLLPSIRQIVGEEIQILETGKPVAEQLKRVLIHNKLENITEEKTENKTQNQANISTYKSQISFYNSSPNNQLKNAMQKLWRNSPGSVPISLRIENEIKFLDLA